MASIGMSKLRNCHHSLQKYENGISDVLAVARERMATAVRNIRDGYFPATPPDGGCPDTCPAIAFCNAYQPKSW